MLSKEEQKKAIEESEGLDLQETLSLIDHNKYFEGLHDIDVVAYYAAERILKEQNEELEALRKELKDD